jgi:DNA-directed DNA polymerase III PolC
MQHSDFVHLHNHSDYSLLDGASPIPRMVARAAELQMPALALTDHGVMFGAVEFYQEARKAGVKPIVGIEAYVTRGKRGDRTRDTAHHLVLLARDEKGFRNLMRLSSLAFLEGFYYRPRMDHEILGKYSEGLLALSACPKGEIASDLLDGNLERAEQTAGMYREMFGADHYFLEMQNHGLAIEEKIRAGVIDLSRRTGIPLVATNDCHYLRHEEAGAHDVLLCIQTGKSIDDPNRLRYETDQVYFKSAEEMKALFPDHPEALRNTMEIAERCNLQLHFGKPLLPAFPLPEGVTPEDHLRERAWTALGSRYSDIGEAIRERFDYELDVICRMGFASYFLIVHDFIDYARQRGIGVGPGRGSVAGSLVAYALRITDIDPLAHGLIFERFLNPERVTMPDIDIDFDDLRRGEVIEYVKKKYGDENVTQIITFGTMGAKGVVRDVGRALGLAFADVDKIAKMVPDGLGMSLERAFELSPDLKELGRRGPAYAKLLHSARVLEGLARHASTHAAGVLITPGPLLDYVPLYRQKDDSVTTQWDMKSIEKAGLLKMDFLGLRTLSVLDETVRLVAEQTGEKIDLATMPLDEPAAYKVFQDAETVGIFQFESSGMRDYLRKLKPTVFGDLVAMNALYRPGPMENIPYFIDCKHGRQVVRFDHSDLEPILKDTYGVFVYQEQVMQAANILAGFSMAQADEMRRAMGKKRPEEMEAKREEFVEGCKRRKIAPAKAEKIFATMEKFAGYGFNKCLASETEIVDAGSGERTTIGSLFLRRRPFSIHALGEDWKLRPRAVTDVIWNGRNEVFRLRTTNGKTIVATGNHPFRTREGWTHLDDLSPGVFIATVPSKADRTDTSSIDLRLGASGEDGMGTALAVAELVSDIVWDAVESIAPEGVQDTYDLTVEGDHNFVADGIIVHNSHSAAYALLAYQCGYLKARFPAEFMAATLSSEMNDSARVVTLIEEVRRLGIELRPPDVNRSDWKFTIEGGAIRFGMGAVRNVGQGAVEGIVEARRAGGPFTHLYDFARRLDTRAINRRVVESLVAAGACDELGGDRSTLFEAVGPALDHASSLMRERESGQSSLFGGDAEQFTVAEPTLPAVEAWSMRERSQREKEVLGFYLSEHPLEPLRDQIVSISTHALADVLGLEEGSDVRVAALVGDIKRLTTRAGKPMAIVTLEDLTGRIECTVFPEAYEAARGLLEADQIVVVTGRVEVRDERHRLLISEVRGLDQARQAYRKCLHIEVRAEDLSEDHLAGIEEILSAFPGDADVYLHIVMPDHSREAMRSKRFHVAESEDVVSRLRGRQPAVRARWGKAAV